MKTIMLIIDDEACKEYESLSPETKQEFKHEVCLLLKKVARDEKTAKLKQLIRDINNGAATGINSELLLRLLPID